MSTIIKNIKPKELISLGFATLLIFVALFDVDIRIQPRISAQPSEKQSVSKNFSVSEEVIIPSEGVILPANWGDLGKQMVETGVIDKDTLEQLYAQRGGLSEETRKLLYGINNGKLRINEQNAGEILNLLWALGLANKNPILEEGPMQNKEYGGAGRFASTGGWSLAKGNAMDHYSKYSFVVLTKEQQELVERVSRNIYRPCCGNSTYFPDCNHGMAMLGFLELMAAQGVSEEEMYRAALQVNSYWFPDTYLTIAKYFSERGIGWDDIDPKEMLGSAYSSASGYQKILAEVRPAQLRGGGSCGV
jgi:hypothetical protein